MVTLYFVLLHYFHFFKLIVTLFDSLSQCGSTKERKESQFLSDEEKVRFLWITHSMMKIKCVVCKLKQCAQHISVIFILDMCCDLMFSSLCYPYKHQKKKKNYLHTFIFTFVPFIKKLLTYQEAVIRGKRGTKHLPTTIHHLQHIQKLNEFLSNIHSIFVCPFLVSISTST